MMIWAERHQELLLGAFLQLPTPPPHTHTRSTMEADGACNHGDTLMFSHKHQGGQVFIRAPSRNTALPNSHGHRWGEGCRAGESWTFFFYILEINDLKTGQQCKAWFGHQRQEMSHSGSYVCYRQGGGNVWSRKI